MAIVFAGQAQAVWYTITFDEPSDLLNRSRAVRSSPTESPPLSLDEIIARAAAEVPGGRVTYVLPPFSPVAPARVTLRDGYSPDRYGQHTLWLDQFSGEVLLRSDPWERSVAGTIFDDWRSPLHHGEFGGLATRLLWFLAGLAPLVLLVTGVSMWLIKLVTGAKARGTRRAPRYDARDSGPHVAMD